MSRARDVADGALGTIAGTNGQVLTSDGNNWSSQAVPTELPAHGADGNVLTSTGSAWASEAPAASGSRTLISNTDLAGSSTVTRTADFSTSYSQYQIELRQFHLNLSGTGVTYSYGDLKLIDDQGNTIAGNYAFKNFHGEYNQSGYDSTANNDAYIYFGLNRSNAASIRDDNGSYYNLGVTLFDPCKVIVESGDTINSTNHRVWGTTSFVGSLDGDSRFSNGVFTNNGQTRKITGVKVSLNDGTFTAGKLLVWGVGS